MAWTAPSTKTTGTLVTAAIWNEQITDNMTFLGASHDHSGHAGDGATISGRTPSGLILPFDANCPSGWTRVSAWDNKFIRASAAYDAVGGGSDTHNHTGPSHTHGVPSHSHTGVAHTHTGPSHQHEQNTSGDSAADDTTYGTGIYATSLSGAIFYMADAGAQSGNSCGSGAANAGTGATGSANANTAAATGTTNAGGTANVSTESSLPSYAAIIFCKKD